MEKEQEERGMDRTDMDVDQQEIAMDHMEKDMVSVEKQLDAVMDSSRRGALETTPPSPNGLSGGESTSTNGS